MKNQLIIIGLITLLICVGLSGCNDIGRDLTSINDIYEHPYNYVNKTVTIKGTIIISKTPLLNGTSINYTLFQKEPTSSIICTFTDKVDTSMLYDGAEYYFTGIIKSYPHSFYSSYLGLEVSKVEEVK